jgi:transposase
MRCWSGWPLTTRGHLEGATAALDGRIDEVIAPFAVARDRLGDHHRGRQRAAEVIIADMRGRHDRVPDRRAPGKLGGPLPGQQHHRGKRRSGKPTKGNRWLADVLTECAWAAARSRDTYLAAQLLAAGPPHRQAEGHDRRGPLHPGHRLVPTGRRRDDHDLGGDFFIRRDSDHARQRPIAQLQALGYQVTLQPAA